MTLRSCARARAFEPRSIPSRLSPVIRLRGFFSDGNVSRETEHTRPWRLNGMNADDDDDDDDDVRRRIADDRRSRLIPTQLAI